MKWILNIIFLCELTIVTPGLPGMFKMANAVSSTGELVLSMTSDFVNCLTLRCALFRTSVSPLSPSHVLMDGKESDDK